LLVPISARDRYAFGFGCTGGHVLGLDELFERQSAALKQCFENMIAAWERSVRQLGDGADIAKRSGSPDLERRLRYRIGVLQARILLLRETFLKPESPA
jgi:hypothetical protein